jgi:hypothetical protein
LVDAGSDFQGKHIFYTNILKQVTSAELEILECVVRNGKGAYVLDIAGEAEFVHDFNFDTADIKLANNLTEAEARKAAASIRNAFEIPGALVLDLFIDDDNSNQHQEFHPDYGDMNSPPGKCCNRCNSSGWVTTASRRGSVEYRVRTGLITELGAHFYFACHEEGFKRRVSTKSRFKRKRAQSKQRKSPAASAGLT